MAAEAEERRLAAEAEERRLAAEATEAETRRLAAEAAEAETRRRLAAEAAEAETRRRLAAEAAEAESHRRPVSSSSSSASSSSSSFSRPHGERILVAPRCSLYAAVVGIDFGTFGTGNTCVSFFYLPSLLLYWTFYFTARLVDVRPVE